MKIHIEYAGIALLSGLLLLINCTWGLPNQQRLNLMGGTPTIQKNLQAINQAKTKAKQLGTTNLSPQERLHFSVREFLISPFAGDDNFTLNAIRNLNPYKLKFDPHFYMYGGGFIYTGAVFLQLSAWIGLTKLIPQADYYLQNPQALGNIFAVLRIMVAVAATIGLVLTYHLARLYFGKTTARLTALILISTPLVHQASRTIEPHIFVMPVFLLAFFFIVLFAKHNQTKYLILAALFSGFSVGIQALSIYISIAFFSALILHYNAQRQNTRQMIGSICTYGILAALAGLSLNPYYVLNFEGFIQDFSRGTGNQLLNAFKLWAPYQLSAFLLCVFLVTPIYHLFRFPKDTFTKLALPCTFASILIYIFLANYHMPYVITALPLFAILSVRMFQDIFFHIRANLRPFFITALVLGFLVFPGARSAYYLINFTSHNREAAGAWINKNIPPGTRIAIRFPPSVWDCVPFQFYNYPLVDYRIITEKDLPDYVVLSNVELPESIRSHFILTQAYKPHPIMGYRFHIDGELHALIGKTIRIYKRKQPNASSQL